MFLLELVPALGLGLLLGRRWPDLPEHLGQPLVRWGVPVSLIGLLLRSGLHWHHAQVAGLALVAVVAGLLLVGHGLVQPTERLGAVIGNTAYFGIPAALALLPAEAIGYAISYDLAATLFTWTLGPLLLAGRPVRPGAVLRALAASPASRGLLGAAVLQCTPWRTVLAAWLWWPARLVMLFSLLLVGMRLAGIAGQGVPRRLWPVLGCKLLGFPLLMLALVSMAAGAGLQLPSLARAALILQAASPTAVAVLLLAEASQDGKASTASAAAALVLWSTLLALLSVPLWAHLLAVLGLHGLDAGAGGA